MRNEYTEKHRYFLYARKSSESEDRQVQSIDDQISRLNDLAKNLNLQIKEVFTEAKSAKQPNCRPVFSKMLSRIEKREADGILCWQINRLSRNPVDSGTISWMLQQSILKSIQTIDRQYLPDDNVLLFNVESGMANQYIIDLRKNCRRGMEGKAKRGWFPSMAPLGYMNDPIQRTIVPDKERFELMRKMWDMMLSGTYTPRQIRIIANEKWGFRSAKHKNHGDKELSNSVMYKLFSNIFYTGMFEWAGKLYNGNHQPMITLEEYDRVQVLLGRKGTPRYQSHEFAYTGLIHCGNCGLMYTATEKTKLVKTSGKVKTYIYYHCTKKKKAIKCAQKPLTVDLLEMQVKKELKKYTILPEFLQWGLEALNVKDNKEIGDRMKIYEMRQNSLRETEKELENLIRMRYKEMVDDDTFIRERDKLKNEITKLNHKLQEIDDHSSKYIELTEQTFRFVTYAQKTFETGTLQQKREILYSLGSNCTIKNQKLFIEAFKWLLPIKKQYPSIHAEYIRLELNKKLSKQLRDETLVSIRQRWWATVEDVRTVFEKLGDVDITIPDFTSQYSPRPP